MVCQECRTGGHIACPEVRRMARLQSQDDKTALAGGQHCDCQHWGFSPPSKRPAGAPAGKEVVGSHEPGRSYQR